MWRKCTKFFLSFVVLFFISSSASYGAYEYNVTHTTALLFDESPLYDSAGFNNIAIFIEEERPPTPADIANPGSMTIKNGTYAYWGDDGRKDVNGDETFVLRCDGVDPDYATYWPLTAGGEIIRFRRTADGGLQDRMFDWSIGGETGSWRIPNFRTTPEQLETYVPFVELTDTHVNGKMMSLTTGQAVTIPYRIRYRIALFGDNKSYDTGWTWIEAGNVISGTFDFSQEIAKGEIKRILFRSNSQEIDEIDGQNRYAWEFFIAEKSNVGIQLTPMELEVNEEKTFNFTLNSDYWITNRNATVYPIIIYGDKSIFTDEDWDLQNNVLTLSLKGNKKGSTSLSVVYTRADGSIYYTEPVTVTVNDTNTTPNPLPSPTPTGGGGGGCDTGMVEAIALLFFVAASLRKFACRK